MRITSFVLRTSRTRAPVVVSARPGLVLTIPASVVLPPAITAPRLLFPPAAALALVHPRIRVARSVDSGSGSTSRPADAQSGPVSAATTADAAAFFAPGVPMSIVPPLPISVSVSKPFPATTMAIAVVVFRHALE